MDCACFGDRVRQSRAIADHLAVDENADVLAQACLVVEHIAARLRIFRKHAIENVAGYGALRHGEAVIVGMRAALALSAVRGGLDARAYEDADAHLAALPVPSAWRELDAGAVIEATSRDKKRHAGGTQFVLLDAIGSAHMDDAVGTQDVRAALERIGIA